MDFDPEAASRAGTGVDFEALESNYALFFPVQPIRISI
jgi:hypothetical protein